MPLYHFNCVNGRYHPDPDGEELRDVRAAQLYAVRTAGQILASEPNVVWDDGQLAVDVTDDRGVLLFSIMTVAVVPKGQNELES